MLNNNQISQNFNSLKALNDNRKSKYHRNYRRYCYTPFASLDSIKNPSVVGYYEQNQELEDDTTPTPQLNVIKSCIDTLTSKIAQSKVRPFFNTQNGSFKDIQIVKQAQAFFDLFYDEQNVNKKVSEAFRDACIFDTGVIYINEKTKEINKALPWQVFVRPAEKNYGKITRVYYEQKDFPVTLLPDFIEYKGNSDYVCYGLYYDTYHHTKAYVIDNQVIKVEEYNSGAIPFVFIHYCSPIIGNTSQSIVDMLNSIQLEIDSLMMKIKDASQLNPANTYFLPQDSNIKATQLNNRVGNVITYKATPNMTSSPVTVSTPPFIDGQYMALIEELKQSAYELVGISQLSAMSAKPAGLNSGIALSTMENIESDRFETQLNQVIRAYVDIAKTSLLIFPPEETILPENHLRVNVKWADIVSESKNMVIQFSAADSLSKDPSTKLQQLQQLAMSGIIPQTRIAQFMELPDIQSGYSLANNAVNAVLSVINDCIEKNVLDVPDYIPFEMLKEEIINTQLSLKAAANADNDNIADIKKLDELMKNTEEKQAMWQSTLAPAEPQTDENGMPIQQNVLTQEANMQQVAPEGDMTAGADMDVNSPQGTALNGAWNAPYQQ